MSKFLLASTAAAALAVGIAVANAQNPSDSQQKPAASSEQHRQQGSAHENKGTAPKADRSAKPRNGRSSQSSQKNERSPNSSPSAERGSGAQNAQVPQSEKMNAAGKSGEAETKSQTNGASTSSKNAQQNEQKPSDQPKAGAASQKHERSTTGQSSRKGDRLDQGSNPSARPGRNTEQKGAPFETADQSNRTGSSQGSSGAAKPEQQAKFNEVIEKQKVQPVTNANFSISVGGTIPRSVRAHEVPRDIVDIDPEYRGKEFVVVRDEIVIIEPRTHKIVSVIPRSGRATTGTSVGHSLTGLQLPPEKRRIIRETVIKEPAAPRCQDTEVTVGGEIPQTITINRFPEDIVREVPEIRSYEFCVKGNQVVLVDPTEHRVVEVID
jgi:hypothetical protein